MIRSAALLLALAPVCFIGPAVPQLSGFSGSYDVATSARGFAMQIAPDRESLTFAQKMEQCQFSAGPGVVPAALCLGSSLH